MIRLLTLGLEVSAAGMWISLIYNAKYGISKAGDRTPFRAAAVAVVLTSVTLMAGTYTAIKINQPVLITTWTPIVEMVFFIVTGALLSIVFQVKKITTSVQHRTFEREHEIATLELQRQRKIARRSEHLARSGHTQRAG